MVVCAVSGCNSSNQQRRVINSIGDENVQFFRIPKDSKYKRKWEAWIGNMYLKSSYAYICSKHFKDEDYAGNFNCEDSQKRTKNFKILRSDAVPSINVPVFRPPGVVPVSLTRNKNFSQIEVSTEKILDTNTNVMGNWNTEVEFSPKWIANQMQFLDHVVMIWVNRCRGGNPSIALLDVMIKTKAKEAAKILHLHINFIGKWMKSFKEKLRKQDARHSPLLDPDTQSTNIVDIINEEYGEFQINKPGIFCVGRFPCTCPDNHWNVEITFSDEWHAKQLKFLDHVMMIWINYRRGGDPNIFMLEWMIKSKANEVAAILQSRIRVASAWFINFKEKLKLQTARNPPIRFKPNLSIDVMDIINEEWPLFRGDDSEVLWDGTNFKKCRCCKDMAMAKNGTHKIPTVSKSNDSIETVEDCCFEDGSEDLEGPDEPDQSDEPDESEEHFTYKESINSYSEVYDCLMVVKSYASSVGNIEALNFIVELEDFVAKEKLGDS